jgi:hypothetical protein|eukprot:SAG25_NODE_499_length_7388_cov_11.651393_4_plen_41_part_00
MRLWGKGQKEDKEVIAKVQGVTKEKLKEMVVAKIQQRMAR